MTSSRNDAGLGARSTTTRLDGTATAAPGLGGMIAIGGPAAGASARRTCAQMYSRGHHLTDRKVCLACRSAAPRTRSAVPQGATPTAASAVRLQPMAARVPATPPAPEL